MQAIATLLRRTSSDQSAMSLWRMLQETCDLAGIKIPQDPHFSWMVAENFEDKAIEDVFANISKKQEEFEISTTGLGLFTGEKPILYIPIVKTEQLLLLHKEIWEQIFPLGVNQSNVYNPQKWIPHITVTSDELSITRLSCVLENIINLPISMRITVDNLALIYSEEESAGIKLVQEFGRKPR